MKYTPILIKKCLPIISILITLSVLLWFNSYNRYGFDFTDESFYLLWIMDPRQFSSSVFSFGFVYHPIFNFLNGDVSLLRSASMFISYSLSSILFFVTILYARSSYNFKNFHIVAISTGMATAILSSFSFGILTPSYNTLNLQGLILASVGVILVFTKKSFSHLLGAILIAIGGTFVFLGKPTSAAALALLVLATLLAGQGRAAVKPILVAKIVSFLLIIFLALAFDGSLKLFWDRYVNGIEMLRVLDGGHTFGGIIRVDKLALSTPLLLAGSILLSVILFSFYVLKKSSRASFVLFSIVIAICVVIIVLETAYKIFLAERLGANSGLLLGVCVVGAIIKSCLNWMTGLTNNYKKTDVALIFYFLLLPLIYAVGTNNNYWVLAEQAYVFLLIIVIILLRSERNIRGFNTSLLIITFIVQTISVILAQNAIMKPYRQPEALHHMASLVTGETKISGLIVSKEYKEYIDAALLNSKRAGFTKDTPLIDLSGHSPGISYLLGAKAVGQPWLLGGYKGSDEFAKVALSDASCEQLSKAWLLVENNGPRSLSHKVIEQYGMNFVADFKPVASWETAKGTGGFDLRRSQQLFKPINNEKTRLLCNTLRQSHKSSKS